MDLGTFLAFCSGAKALLDVAERALGVGERTIKFADSAARSYALISGISTGRTADARLAIQPSNTIIKLSDEVFLDRNTVEAVNIERNAVVSDTYVIRDALTSVARQMKSRVLSSQVSEAPELMQRSLEADPFAFLIDPQPAHRASKPPNDNYVPILFSIKGQPFVGWQLRGALRGLFGCSFNPYTPAATSASQLTQMAAQVEVNLRNLAGRHRLYLKMTDESDRCVLAGRGVDASGIWLSVGFPTPIEIGYRAPSPYLHFSQSRLFCTANFGPLDYDSSISIAGFANAEFVRGMLSRSSLIIKSLTSREKMRLYVDEPRLAADTLRYIQSVISHSLI